MIEGPHALLPETKFSEDDSIPRYTHTLTLSWRIKKSAFVRQLQDTCQPPIEQPKEPEIYEDLNIAQRIPIKYVSTIKDKRFGKHVIYEAYRPCNLKEMLDYMNFCLKFRTLLPNEIGLCRLREKEMMTQEIDPESIMNSPFVSEEIKAYYNADLKTDLPSQIDQTAILVFDSNFESGNLLKASIVSLNEYNLFLCPDTNTHGNCQWFYFAVTNTTKDSVVSFNILNCTKSIGLFKDGMHPMTFSELEFIENKNEWIPDTFNITYTKNNIKKTSSLNDKVELQPYFTLKFSYKFKHTGDRVYFAYCRPYTLTMQFILLEIIKNKLMDKASSIHSLNEDELQMKIKEFINNPEEKKKPIQIQKSCTDSIFISKNILNELSGDVDAVHNWRYSWMKAENIEIESQGIIYRQETLCRTFCGIPILLLTITNTE